ncbi:MAG: periplasmic heavy metal sensor [Desulfovibrionaceae bacterium]
MKTSKFFVPALLAVTLLGGTAFVSDAFSAPHGGGHGGHEAMGYSDGNTDGNMGCPGMMTGCAGMNEGGRGYHKGGMGYHMGQIYYSLSPEKRAQFDTLVKDFKSKTSPMRDAMFVKKQELRALQNAATPDVSAVSKTATEITTLRNQLRAEHENFMNTLEKDLGIKDIYGSNAAPEKAPKGPRK